jgi:hypothetical protein
VQHSSHKNNPHYARLAGGEEKKLVDRGQLPGYEMVFPSDAGIVNIRDYGAIGDGLTDDTEAIQKAISQNIGIQFGTKTLYLPDGIYLVSNCLEWRDLKGRMKPYLTLQGQSRERTILKLKHQSPGFGDPDNPKAVICTAPSAAKLGKKGAWTNEAFRNSIHNLTVHTGTGNPGAIGVDYMAHNQGAIRDVTIRSGDGQGFAGIDMSRKAPGPCIIKNVWVDGFNYGVRIAHTDYSITLEYIALTNQKLAGIDNTSNILSLRHITSENAVPAICNSGPFGLVALVDGDFKGGSPTASAIVNKGTLYARNINTEGYRSAVEDSGSVIEGTFQREFVSGEIMSLFASPNASLNLPVKETPAPPYEDLENWVSVKAFGATPYDYKDDTKAIQKAMASGESTIYFPSCKGEGRYVINRTIRVPGHVNRLVGMESTLHIGSGFRSKTGPVFVVEGDTDEVLTIERIYGFAYPAHQNYPNLVWIMHASSRPLVIKDSMFGTIGVITYRSTSVAGPLFVEDVSGGRWRFDHRQDIWARQLNPENPDLEILNNGANLWILGLKTEIPSTNIVTKAGGRTELLGGLLYPGIGYEWLEMPKGISPECPAFINHEASHSLIYAVTAHSDNANWQIQIKETRDGETKLLKKKAAPLRGSNPLATSMPLYVGY